MKTEIRYETILVEGNLDDSTSPELLRDIFELTEQGTVNLILDLNEVHFMSSTGIGLIIEAAKDLTKLGGELLLVCSNPKIISLLEMTRVANMIQIFETLLEAEAFFEKIS